MQLYSRFWPAGLSFLGLEEICKMMLWNCSFCFVCHLLLSGIVLAWISLSDETFATTNSQQNRRSSSSSSSTKHNNRFGYCFCTPFSAWVLFFISPRPSSLPFSPSFLSFPFIPSFLFFLPTSLHSSLPSLSFPIFSLSLFFLHRKLNLALVSTVQIDNFSSNSFY